MSTGVVTGLTRQNPTAGGNRYSAWIQFAAVTALIWYLFYDILAYMAYDWWTVPALSQGMLLPPLALYIAWINRNYTLSFRAATDLRGLIMTGFACCALILGKVASEFFLARISFVILVTGLIWTFWGIARLRTLAFPLLLLATMVPLPVMVYNSLAAPLQLLASDIGASIAQTAGVSIYRDGNILHLANTTLGVAEACSGLHSLSSLVVGSLLFGFLLCSHPIARFLLFLLAVPLAITMNVIRVAGTAILADYNEELALGFYHSLSGWMIFVVGVAGLYVLARLLNAVIPERQIR